MKRKPRPKVSGSLFSTGKRNSFVPAMQQVRGLRRWRKEKREEVEEEYE